MLRRVRATRAGGSSAFGDPDARLGYAYVMNKLDFWLMDEPLEEALRDAVFRAIPWWGQGAVSRPVAVIGAAYL